METELDAFLFQELNHETMNPNPDILSSWIEELDRAYSPASFLQESRDFQMLDDHHLIAHLTSSELEPDPFPPVFPTTVPDTHDHSYPFTVFEFGSQISSESPECHFEPDPCDTFLNNVDLSLIAPTDSQESIIVDDIFDPMVELETPRTTKTPMTVNIETTKTMTSFQTTNGETLGLQCCDQEENNNEYNEDESDDEAKQRGGISNCRNLVSERKRRRRLSQQLLALRALVPNITKMDKRSVLVDALFYLKSIHEETSRFEAALKQQPHHHQHPTPSNNNHQESFDHTGETLGVHRTLASSRPKPQIIDIDIEKMENTRFVVKIRCQGGVGVGGHVLRVMETMGFEISYTSMENIKSEEVLTTIFMRVKKQEKMTEEKLKDGIIHTAVKSGLTIQKP